LFQRNRAIQAQKQQKIDRRIQNLERELAEAEHPAIKRSLEVQIKKLKQHRVTVTGR
jgi:hypothetical protein